MEQYVPSYGLAQYLDGADNHYVPSSNSTPNEGFASQPMSTPQSRGVPSRKPVGSGIQYTPKPVNGMNDNGYPILAPNRSAAPRPQPQSRQQSSRSANTDKALPALPYPPRVPEQRQPSSPRIYMDSRGRFDPSTIGNKPLDVNPVMNDPSFRLRQQMPETASRQPASPATSRRDSRDSRRESDSGWFFQGHKRRDSNASYASSTASRPGSRSGSRRGSFANALKGAGEWFKDTYKIASMNQAEREKYNNDIRRYEAHKAEAERKADFSRRPLEEQQYIVDRHIATHPNWVSQDAPTNAAIEVLAQESKSKAARAKAREIDHANKAVWAKSQGTRASTPDSNKSSPSPNFSIRAEDRQAIFEQHGHYDQEVEMKARPQFIGGIQGKVSKAFDPFKRQRKGSDSSSMDMGMTDEVPPEMMNDCARCGQKPKSYLNGGLCEVCHFEKKRGGK